VFSVMRLLCLAVVLESVKPTTSAAPVFTTQCMRNVTNSVPSALSPYAEVISCN
jgi:hypothetical protein